MAEMIRRDEGVLSESEKDLLIRTLSKLEEFYPEHKTYAMDALCNTQRENCNKISKKLGYDNVDEFLLAYGFEPIKGQAVIDLRKNIGITPGNEPELIKTRVDNSVKSLNEYYPDHVIEGALQSQHKKLAQTLAALWQWMGYTSMEDMLSAYGFTYIVKAGRKATVDPDAIISELKKRYPEGVVMTAQELKDANPDLKLKSVMNMAKDLFGMPFSKYLLEQGILLPGEPTPKKTYEEKLEYQRNYAKERQQEKAAKDLEEYEQYYMKSYIGWRMLPPTADLLFQDHDHVKQAKTIKNAVRTSAINADEYFSSLGVIASDKTDNELRLRIQQIDFREIAKVINLEIQNVDEDTDICSEMQLDYIPAIKKLSSERSSITMTQIAEYLGVSASSVSKAIGILEAEGLIIKDEDKGPILSSNGQLMYKIIKLKIPEQISIKIGIDL